MKGFTFTFAVPRYRFDGAIEPRPVSVEATIPLADRVAYERFLAGRKVIKAEIIGGRWDGLSASFDPKDDENPDVARPGQWETKD